MGELPTGRQVTRPPTHGSLEILANCLDTVTLEEEMA